VSHCGGIRKPAHRHGATGTTRGSVDGGRGGTTSHHGRARSKRRSVDPPEPHRRRETAGCSIVRPTGGNSFRAGGKGGTGKIPFGRGATSSRTNEARVLEIEAADGRNRSYASRVKGRVTSQDGASNLALARDLHGTNRADAVHGKSPSKTVCEASSCSTPNSRRSGPQAKAGG